MDNESQTTLSMDDNLSSLVTNKLNYLSTLQGAVVDQDDRHVYELLDPSRYSREVREERASTVDDHLPMMVTDIEAALAHHLNGQLIDFLGNIYPFFYYEEAEMGRFNVYFGNWWDRRLFGTLDVLKVAFNFDADEYQKLSATFQLADGEGFNDAQVNNLMKDSKAKQELIDSQNDRDVQKSQLHEQLNENSERGTLPWDSGKVKRERQALMDQLTTLEEFDDEAKNARQIIKDNEDKILILSKEETVLGYEKDSIVNTFKTFEKFEQQNEQLYVDYMKFLQGKAQD